MAVSVPASRRNTLRSRDKNHFAAAISCGNIFCALALIAFTSVIEHDDEAFMLPTTHVPLEPQTRDQAMRSPQCDEWIAAEGRETASLDENNVFIVSDLPKGRKLVRTKWIYKIKRDKNGAISKYKARLVAQGFTQVEGVDYTETYSPVARLSTVRTILAIAALKGYDVHQMDVDTAFLYGELQEEIYVRPPVGYPCPPGKVLRLNKALYGLKQSPREWNNNINQFIVSLGFVRSQSDPCVYRHADADGEVILVVYVDDIIIAGSSLDRINDVKQAFNKKYKMKDLGQLEFVLGVQVDINKDKGTIRLSQRQYVLDMLASFGLHDCNPSKTPLSAGTYLSRQDCPTTETGKREMEKYRYREAVGSLLWLANGTRPDIAFAVSQVAKFMSNPGKPHWAAVKSIMRYLKGSLEVGITYTR